MTAHPLLIILLQIHSDIRKMLINIFYQIITVFLLQLSQLIPKFPQALHPYPTILSLLISLTNTIIIIKAFNIGLNNHNPRLDIKRRIVDFGENTLPKVDYLINKLRWLLFGKRRRLDQTVAFAIGEIVLEGCYCLLSHSTHIFSL